MQVYLRAVALARSEQEDEEARLQLRDSAVRAPASAKDAFRRLSLQPDAFDYDRAFRLLEAAVNDKSV
jgi:hypothetical protein